MTKFDPKTSAAVALDMLKQLDALIHQNFPVGGHANVEKAQQLVNELRREVEKWL